MDEARNPRYDPKRKSVRRHQQGDRWTSDGICESFYREVCCGRQRNQTGSASLRTGLSPESSSAMTTDFETLPCISSLAIGKMGDGELFFTFPEVLEVIGLCTTNQIAVLGLELFEV